MTEAHTTFTMRWSQREILVSHQANWLNSSHWHIELRSDERLPVTETGYRSLFVTGTIFATDAEIERFIVAWLDEAAASAVWQAYILDSRQLKLF